MNINKGFSIILLLFSHAICMHTSSTFANRCRLIHSLMKQELTKLPPGHLTPLIFPDHPKALVHFLLTGRFIDERTIDFLITDKQFIEDYTCYEKCLEANELLRNALDVRLSIDPERAACIALATYSKSRRHLHILETIKRTTHKAFPYHLFISIPQSPFKTAASF